MNEWPASGPGGSYCRVEPEHSLDEAWLFQPELIVEAPGGPVTFDLDLILGRHAGVQVVCPRR